MKRNKFCFKKYAMLSWILIIIILILDLPCFAKIPPDPCCIFGSRVTFGDEDEGNPLNICCHGFGFYDIGTEKNVYDENDPVYLDMDANKFISINDIRITPFLTPFAIYIPGSKVTRTDADINASLEDLTDWSIAYTDLNENNIYDLLDPLYLHDENHGNSIVSGDIRLTFFEGYFPGSRVMNYSADFNSSSLDLMGIYTTTIKPADLAEIRFFNANGNYLNGFAIYDLPDAVYLHIVDPNQKTLKNLYDLGELEDIEEKMKGKIGFVGPNDLRLSI